LSKSTDKPEKSTNTCIENGETCHWVIEPPNGPVSMGKCKKCGTQKEFKNSFEYNTWHGERPSKDKDNSKKNDSND
tara:strand:+ start:7964 stop:8191 length:228 start_codon:yes stop_codon:yes gene_type:complete